jgi:hypothetical protein
VQCDRYLRIGGRKQHSVEVTEEDNKEVQNLYSNDQNKKDDMEGVCVMNGRDVPIRF